MMTVMNLCSLEFQIPISFFTQTVNEKTVQNLCSDPQTWLNWPSWPESPKSPGSQQWADFTGDQIDFTDLDNSNMDKHIFYHFINKIFQKGFINKDETIHHREIAQKSRYIPLLSSAQCPRCKLGIALNRTRSDQSQIVGFVVWFTKRFVLMCSSQSKEEKN